MELRPAVVNVASVG